jgi:PucR family transcriptional regulator, purine catabolism regulatory protein
MALTLRGLVADRKLGLRVLVGGNALDRTIGWVHVSELDDPTPFLEGGELLLTTGLRVGADTDFAAFVARLVDRGLAGLGLGTGLGHDTVPGRLILAAHQAGLPLLEVPKRTPFIAISKAVSAAIAADSYAEVTATNTAQRELTAAALHGPSRVVQRLARLLDAWVLLLDPAGSVVAVTPPTAAHRLENLSGELDRLRGHVASASFDSGGDRVAVQALSDRGVLVVGRPEPLDRIAQHALTAAASLLTLGLARAGALGLGQRALRAAVLRLLFAGQLDLAADVWSLPAEPVEVYVFTGSAEHRDRALELLESRDVCAAVLDDHLVALNASGALDGLRGGVSVPVEYSRAAQAYRQAARAAESARPGTLVSAREQTGAGLLALMSPEEAQRYAESLLGPVLRHDANGRGDLAVSLAEWLRRHGQWDPAATRLGVHRHTLRNRIAKVAELTGRDLDSPGTRAEFWVALQLLESGATHS